MNVKLLRKVKKHILAEPKRLEMGSYILRKEEGSELLRPYAKCGTAACIAGWACILEMGKSAYYLGAAAHEEAMNLLGIDEDEADRLFIPGNWPDEFEDGYGDDGKKKTALIAAARIEHFIKTNGAE